MMTHRLGVLATFSLITLGTGLLACSGADAGDGTTDEAAATSALCRSLKVGSALKANRDASLRDGPAKDRPEIAKVAKGQILRVVDAVEQGGYLKVSLEVGGQKTEGFTPVSSLDCDPSALGVNWVGPAPGTVDNPIPDADQKLITAAYAKIKDNFYSATNAGYTAKNGPAPDYVADTTTCTAVCPPFWGDLVCHFYCGLPSYSSTYDPNMRACFSGITRARPGDGGDGTILDTAPSGGTAIGRPLFYPEAHDYCLYQDADLANHTRMPAYDTNLIASNRAAGQMVGALSWLGKNPEVDKAFRYVMYTYYDFNTLRDADQQKVVNAFYGVTLRHEDYGAVDAAGAPKYSKADDDADKKTCNKKRRVRAPGLDPTDGTHCSTARPLAGRAQHPAFAAIKPFMEAYAKQ